MNCFRPLARAIASASRAQPLLTHRVYQHSLQSALLQRWSIRQHSTAGAAATPAGVMSFQGQADLYGGFIVDADTLPASAQDFSRQLTSSLEEWRSRAYAGIWLKLPIARAECIPLAVAQGFEFHHAEAGYVMLTRWLKAAPSTLPPNASHQLGAGACVLNARGELLVVRERHGPAGKLGVWKMPTGLVHAGEDVSEGVVREVLEETGLEVEFDCVLALRQVHGFAFGKSDMFFMCGLRPAKSAKCDADGRPLLQPCMQEVEAAIWQPLAEYCQSDFVQSRPAVKALARVMTAYADGTYRGLKVDKLEDGRKELLIYDAAADGVMPRGWENC